MSDEADRRARIRAARDFPETVLPGVLRQFPPRLRAEIPVRPGQTHVQVWRAVPGGVTQIRPGDWVTLTRAYAEVHLGERDGWKILRLRVPVEHVMWAGTDENEWFYVPPETPANPDEGLVLYRGTRGREDRTVRGASSWTPSLGVALIWSARPGDLGHKAEFLESSTIHVGRLRPGARVLTLCGGSNVCSFAEVLRALQYQQEGGISDEEATKILNYLHNREIGRAPGGEFMYRVVDDEGEEVCEADIPFSIRSPITRVSEFRDGDWDDERMEAAGRLDADSFIFADAPAVHRAAKALGYDALRYTDVFDGGTYAARELLGAEVEDIEGVEMDSDLDYDEVPVHETIRPLTADALTVERSVPLADMLAQWRARFETLDWSAE